MELSEHDCDKSAYPRRGIAKPLRGCIRCCGVSVLCNSNSLRSTPIRSTCSATDLSYDEGLAQGFATLALHAGQDHDGDVSTKSRAVPIYATTRLTMPHLQLFCVDYAFSAAISLSLRRPLRRYLVFSSPATFIRVL